MIREILPVGPLACNCTIFGSEATGEALVVDPGDEVGWILECLARHRLHLAVIVVTHAHIDHIGGAARLKAATGAPVLLHRDDLPIYDQLEWQAAWLGVAPPERVALDHAPQEGERIPFGDGFFQVIETPGHTPGSISLWHPAEKVLVAGDTLFRDSIGRTDLPGGDAGRILRSIRDKLLVLPEETLVIPGHGPTTTLGRERVHNFFLQHL